MEPVEEPGVLETDAVVVRKLTRADLDDVVRIDAAASGRRRPDYFELMLRRSLDESRLQMSLVAELEGRTAGFVIASLYYGQFGVVEPTATVDAIAVDPAWRGRSVGRALMRQLGMNLGALRIHKFRTEVSWDDFDLLRFFRRSGFRPSTRLCLEREIDPTDPG